jgi:hypothetical protein
MVDLERRAAGGAARARRRAWRRESRPRLCRKAMNADVDLMIRGLGAQWRFLRWPVRANAAESMSQTLQTARGPY